MHRSDWLKPPLLTAHTHTHTHTHTTQMLTLRRELGENLTAVYNNPESEEARYAGRRRLQHFMNCFSVAVQESMMTSFFIMTSSCTLGSGIGPIAAWSRHFNLLLTPMSQH